MDAVPAHPTKPTPVPATAEAMRLSRDASVAWFSLLANRLVHEQVRNAYAWGQFVREQSHELAKFSGRASDPGIGEALALLARIGVDAGDAIVEAAVDWGRRHGHLAFAIPVAGCPNG